MITAVLSRTFRWMQERREAQARRRSAIARALGLAEAQEMRELASRLDLVLGRARSARRA